jgi:MtN3 and saliva related transmembrane protein
MIPSSDCRPSRSDRSGPCRKSSGSARVSYTTPGDTILPTPYYACWHNVVILCVSGSSDGNKAATMFNPTFLGLAAAFCTTVAFLPQVVKTWKTRSTADISLGTFVVLLLGIVLWLAYGVLLGDAPLIVSNGITLVLAGSILDSYVRDHRQDESNKPNIVIEARRDQASAKRSTTRWMAVSAR